MVPWNKRVTLNQNSDLENKTSIIKQNGGLETGRCPRNKMMVLKQEGVQKTKWWSWNRKVSKKQNGDLKKENKNLNVDHETKYFIYSIQSEQRTATEFLLENMKLTWPWNKIDTLKQKKNGEVITLNLPSHSSLISDKDPEASLSSRAGNPRDQEYELICSRRYPGFVQTLSTPTNLKNIF